MIARIWRGKTEESKAEEFFNFMLKTGVKDLSSTEGNQGVLVFRRVNKGYVEFLMISLWESYEAIRRFAGEDISKAVYYPEDKDYLVKLEPNVEHYEVLYPLQKSKHAKMHKSKTQKQCR